MTKRNRVILISIDIAINVVLGIIAMSYPGTLLFNIMRMCPVAISPVIFVLEFVLFICYYR